MKKVDHKRGRGGVNAPKRRRVQSDDEKCDNVEKETNSPFG